LSIHSVIFAIASADAVVRILLRSLSFRFVLQLYGSPIGSSTQPFEPSSRSQRRPSLKSLPRTASTPSWPLY